MEYILAKVTQQAMNYAIRSGVTLTASYAIKQSSRLIQSAPKSNVTEELYEVQQRLHHKIRIVSPAIDMIELIAARGNTSLESAVSLTKELRLAIQNLGQRMAKAAASSEEYRTESSRSKAVLQTKYEDEIKLIILDVKKLLTQIEDAVPLINLALTTSGAKMSTQLPSSVSPSRLLQASTFLTAGDRQYMLSPHKVAQIGPTFTLTIYMLFAGHDRPETEEEIRNTTWKEVMHKAQVKLRRVPLDVVLSTGSGSDALQSHEISSSQKTALQADSSSHVRAEARAEEYAYQLMIVEDFDDDRHHDFDAEDAKPAAFDDVKLAGIRDMIPIHEISKIFYADTSRVLNIGMDAESNHPVLLLRRDVHAMAPRRMIEPLTLDVADQDQQPQIEAEEGVQDEHSERRQDPWRLPPSLDLEWIAFEVYSEAEDSSSEPDRDSDDKEAALETHGEEPDASQLPLALAHMHIHSPSQTTSSAVHHAAKDVRQPWVPQIKTSLSMLELLLRLTSLQQFQQQSHLSIPDELLNFFLEESASTGAGGDEQHRQAIRADARRRVGWDPYDESPVKRRGEDYQYGQSAYSETPHMRAEYQSSYNDSIASPGYQPHSISPAAQRSSPVDLVTAVHQPPDPRLQPIAPRPTPFKGRETWTSSPASRRTNDLATTGNRTEWLRRQGDTASRGMAWKETGLKDEGIGTSPGSTTEP